MDPLRTFFDFLNKFISLSEEEFNTVIKPHISLRQFKKKELITVAGEVERYLNFVIKGLARKFFRNGNEELITQISLEGHIIHAQGSFHKQRPSHYFVEAIEPTTLISIDFDSLNEIFATNAKMERMGRLVITDIMVLNDRWQMMLLKMSPRERFLDFVDRNPELLQRTPQKYLASLLNIQPETFSRFKHLLKGR
ncbi:MAG: Crp/Fnr family transcriptional regulator [Chitinophagaceae bacterium]|nr:MAG: Crp/Fnr family transcriptional regulator [Chitinophagaceae bacterium]